MRNSSLYALLSLLLLCGRGECEESPFPGHALDAGQLDALRGGFQTDGGLKISLGIERTMLLNGMPVSTTVLNIPDLAAVDGRGGGVQLQGPALSLIQNGPRNTFDPAVIQALAPGMATILQNTLDNQVLQGRTVLNVTVSGVGGLRLSSGLQGLNAVPALRLQ